MSSDFADVFADLEASMCGFFGVGPEPTTARLGGSRQQPPASVALRLLTLPALPRDAQAVQSAYRSAVLRHHPDHAAGAGVLSIDELRWARDDVLARVSARGTEQSAPTPAPPGRPTVTAAKVSGRYTFSRNDPVPPPKPPEPRTCKRCGVVHTRDNPLLRSGFGRKRWIGYCQRCAWVAELERQRDLRLQARAHTPCGVCGQPFTPPRSDARYCSPACRQRAYRQRAVASA